MRFIAGFKSLRLAPGKTCAQQAKGLSRSSWGFQHRISVGLKCFEHLGHVIDLAIVRLEGKIDFNAANVKLRHDAI